MMRKWNFSYTYMNLIEPFYANVLICKWEGQAAVTHFHQYFLTFYMPREKGCQAVGK
jgi:hypothetical protein